MVQNPAPIGGPWYAKTLLPNLGQQQHIEIDFRTLSLFPNYSIWSMIVWRKIQIMTHIVFVYLWRHWNAVWEIPQVDYKCYPHWNFTSTLVCLYITVIPVHIQKRLQCTGHHTRPCVSPWWNVKHNDIRSYMYNFPADKSHTQSKHMSAIFIYDVTPVHSTELLMTNTARGGWTGRQRNSSSQAVTQLALTVLQLRQ